MEREIWWGTGVVLGSVFHSEAESHFAALAALYVEQDGL